MNLRFPLQFDGRGRTREASDDYHVRQMIEQVLFTSPGERVNQPDFGSGLLQLPFATNSPEQLSSQCKGLCRNGSAVSSRSNR
jgi:phage baseplate assembly protein W